MAVKVVGDRVFLVTFMQYDLGYFDDETRRLEPIENPFGPKVLPMSRNDLAGLLTSSSVDLHDDLNLDRNLTRQRTDSDRRAGVLATFPKHFDE